MVRYWKYVVVSVFLVAVLFLLGIAMVIATPDVKKFVIGGAVVAVIASGITGAIFGIGWARSR